MDKIVIGKVIKPQGVRGEVKIQPITNDPARFSRLKTLYIGDSYYKIASVAVRQGFVFLTLSGINSRDDAEDLVGLNISIERIFAPALNEGEYFIADLTGCKFRIDGAESGIVKSILQNGAADVFEVKLNDGSMLMFPFLKSLNLNVDLEGGFVDIAADALNNVAVYYNEK